MNEVVHPFPPVVGPESRTLILGSFPSVRSREEGFFYGHPRNRFWPMLAAIYSEEAPLTIPEKQSLILRHGLALWDVIASCRIEGSSDASVRDAVPVDIARVTAVAPIERVICNGALAGRLYARHLQPQVHWPALVLPSTSPANAAWSLARLTEAWRGALPPSAAQGTILQI
ncbi:MAG: DNA-deoxyinosine glycosylase [Aristaeellaceae bacterium]